MKRKKITTRIDVRIPGYVNAKGKNRFLQRTGATTKAEEQAFRALFQKLIDRSQFRTIRLLDDKKITFAELRDMERQNRLGADSVDAEIRMARRLWDTADGLRDGVLSQWLATLGGSPCTRDRYECSFGQLKRYAADELPADAIVRDLRTANWRAIFGVSMADLSPGSRNNIKLALGSFLTGLLGDQFHPERRAVMKAMGRKERYQRPPSSLTIPGMWTNVRAMDEVLQPIPLTLFASNMRIGEYLSIDPVDARMQLEAYGRVWVKGKTGSDFKHIGAAFMPWAVRAFPCPLGPAPEAFRGSSRDGRYHAIYMAFQAAAKKTGIPWTPHDLRRLYAQVATGKLPTVVVQQAMGHADPEMTNFYARQHNVDAVAEVVAAAAFDPVHTPLRLVKP